jgi:hypothetical protein
MKNYKLEPNSDKNFLKEQAYARAKKRVNELKGFYWHAFWYVAVNLVIIYMIVSNGGKFLSFGTFSTAIFWGMGLGFHAIAVFGKNFIFSKSWEDQKIKEFMENDKKQWK